MAAQERQDQPRETPGQAPDLRGGIVKIVLGLVSALVLTGASFWAAASPTIWPPGVPVLLAALAIGQMGVHLVFFLHVSSGAEATNTILALAFGVFVVALVVFGSMIIMANLTNGMASPAHVMSMAATLYRYV